MEDNGLGIRLQDQPHLFKQFSSFKDHKRNINTKGIGLGLVICKMIVQKFNGRIGFTSTYNQGSTFFYDFEIEEYTASEQQVALQSRLKKAEIVQYRLVEEQERAKGSSCTNFIETYAQIKTVLANRILVVDDEEFCISAMKILLGLAGIDTER